MRIKVFQPEPMAARKRWRWQLVDEADRLLAASPELESEAECEDVVRKVTEECGMAPPVFVEPPHRIV